MEVGHAVDSDMTIPPNQQSFTVTGVLLWCLVVGDQFPLFLFGFFLAKWSSSQASSTIRILPTGLHLDTRG